MSTRREFLAAPLVMQAVGPEIDRRKLVERHQPLIQKFDPLAPLSIGNGELAFTADVTGLQTFAEQSLSGIPLCTQSQWGWHSFPLPKGLDPATFRLTKFDTHGREVGYATSGDGQRELYNWLRENPHRLNLARLAFPIARPDEIQEPSSRLYLWNGMMRSRFLYKGKPVHVTAVCHPTRDALAFRIEGALPVILSFPYGSPAEHASDWAKPDAHTTTLREGGRFERKLDGDSYVVQVHFDTKATITQTAPHTFRLTPDGPLLEFTLSFAKSDLGTPIKTGQAFEAAARHWPGFWSSGGALDFSGCGDARAKELERRCVLSQYLTAIQCSGSAPPQETGLTCNSWYGKFHLEMHWWHAVHFALWNRPELLNRSLDWYATALPAARSIAKQQGYRGARWPKMTDLSGRDSPSPIGPMLIWEQPHPIYYAELMYRAKAGQATLDRFRAVVFESADFMADFAWLDSARGQYVLGPPVIPAQENHPPKETWNPTYELVYWRFALKIAQEWRARLKLAPDPRWADVIARLAPLPVKDGVYLAHENCPQTYTERNRDHPSMLMALGVLPGEGVDRETMRRTLRKVFSDWRWADTWGWDYPMVALTAARLGEASLAIDALLMDTPKNHYAPNGHNWQRANLPLYLPGNGGLLTALAHMAATGGFPKQGWAVSAKNLSPLF